VSYTSNHSIEGIVLKHSELIINLTKKLKWLIKTLCIEYHNHILVCKVSFND